LRVVSRARLASDTILGRFAAFTVLLNERFTRTRSETVGLIAPLNAEDVVVQSMDDASPTKWHLAHTSWFFETFVLVGLCGQEAIGEPGYETLFNSYYNGIGPQFHRPSRGLLTRPSLEEILDYRARVDAAMLSAIRERSADAEILRMVELGLQHEQQHQELILTDLLHAFSFNPLEPRYHEPQLPDRRPADPLDWHAFEGGLIEVGHRGDGFAYDNEGPPHRVRIEAFELADRLLTNGEVRAFIADGGYQRPELWHDEGWALAQAEGWNAPLYWRESQGQFVQHSLTGTQRIRDEDPAAHLSWFEAAAIAHWMDARLPTEFEWEHAASQIPVEGNFRDSGLMRPSPPAAGGRGPRQMFGDLWEWTSSSYAPYPGFRAVEGAVGEYNGKFMVNQYVLRGGSCASTADHVRATYRNFFPTHARWQFSGVRPARDARRTR
jgi:ergothioneine biosynthesis protein EgtB